VTDQTRSAELTRKTGETDVELSLTLDGRGGGERSTGVGFFDHMLDLFARHGNFDLTVRAEGDLQTGAHHTVEDVGIVLGQAFDRALGDRAGITRYATATVPMDEARATTSIDISGRSYVAFDGGSLPSGPIADFDSELTEEFLRAFAGNARMTLHTTVEAGSNAHHIVEAVFKSLARALRTAVAIDPSQHGVPSTKGTLTD
jgi:imidazoleglycerol-phosphate dehydratase